MMKFFVSILLMMMVSFASCLYFPWWSIAVACFLIATLIPQKKGIAFLTGFIALFLLWGGLSFWISSNNQHVLAHRISQLILKKDNPLSLILVTGLIGAIVGGISSLTGSLMRSSISNK